MSYQLLKDIINQNCFENITDSIVTLIEPRKNSSLKIIHILDVPSDIIILKGDVFQLNTIFGDGKDYIKRCDYLIVSNDTLFFIELKSNEEAPFRKFKDVNNQFKTVECIIDLIDSVISRFSNSSFRLNGLKRKFFLLVPMLLFPPLKSRQILSRTFPLLMRRRQCSVLLWSVTVLP